MSSLPESVKLSIESTQVKRRKPVGYIYDRDIPTKIRPQDRHYLVVTGDPPVKTVGNASTCPCQTYFEDMPTAPFATEELEKEFWSRLHLMMPQRDAGREMHLRERQLLKNRAQESAAKKGKDKGEGSAQKTPTDSSDSDDKRDRERQQQCAGGGTAVESENRAQESAAKKGKDKGEGSEQKTPTDSSDSDDKRERKRRKQCAGGGTAVESVTERVRSDRQRRAHEKRIANVQRLVTENQRRRAELYKVGGQPQLPRNSA